MNNDDITAQLNTDINDTDMVLHAIPVECNDDRVDLPEGHVHDIGQILTWEPSQIKKLQDRLHFYYNVNDRYHAPVILLYNQTEKASCEAKSERFTTFGELVERLKIKDCIVYQIIQNNHTHGFMLRKFDIPADFDFELHLIIQSVIEILYETSKRFRRDGKIIHDLYPEIVKLSLLIKETKQVPPIRNNRSTQVDDLFEAFKTTYKHEQT